MVTARGFGELGPKELNKQDWLVAAPCPRILVAESLVPAAAAWLASQGVRAVVTDQGGLLSHGAILARELGILAVLGTGDATRRLHPDMYVRVDADLGLVCWPGRA